MSVEETIEAQVNAAMVALLAAASCGHHASAHALRVLLADRDDLTRGSWLEAFASDDGN